jgi:hypothetical protein
MAVDHETLLAMLTRLKLTAIRDGLDTLLDEAARRDLTLRGALAFFCAREVARKDERRIAMALKIAHFPHARELENFDFAAQPSLDAHQIRELASGRWIAHGDALLLLGRRIQRHDAHLSTLLEFHDFLIWIACSRPRRMRVRAVQRHDLRLRNRTRRALADLDPRDRAGADQPQYRHLAHAEPRGGLFQRQLTALGHLARTMRRHAVVATVAAHARLRPRIAASGPLAETVQRGGDRAVDLLPGERADQVAHVRVAAPAMLAGPVARHGEAGVIAAAPMDHELDPLLGQRRDDLLEDGAQDHHLRTTQR